MSNLTSRITPLAGMLMGAVVALAGCSGGPTPKAAPATPEDRATTTAQTTAGQESSRTPREEAFLGVARDNAPSTLDDNALLSAGHATCYIFANDGADTENWMRTVKTLIDGGFTAGQAGGLIGASTAAFCPEYNDLAPLVQ